MSDTPTTTTTYRVGMPHATVREEPRQDARPIARLDRGESFTGRVVSGTIPGRTAQWVRRDIGGYVLLALLDEEQAHG